MLRKDFLRTRYDVVQSAAYGADAVLAIVAGLDDDELHAMLDEARAYELDVLVEVHDERRTARARSALGATMLGINNRDLRTFETNLAVTAELLPLVPSSHHRDQRERRALARRRRAAVRGGRARFSDRRIADALEREGARWCARLRGAGVPA